MAEDDDRSKEWASAEKTTADAVPRAVSEADTSRPETTGRTRLTSAEFASAIDATDRDAYARGLEHGQRAAKADAEAAAVTEHRKIREDAIEAFRSLWIIFDLDKGGRPPPWKEAEPFARRRMTPL